MEARAKRERGDDDLLIIRLAECVCVWRALSTVKDQEREEATSANVHAGKKKRERKGKGTSNSSTTSPLLQAMA
mgnify:CR=1 FL=1